MDSVRFGRALGVGARAAAKTLVTAVDAATSPNPTSAKPAVSPGGATKQQSARAAAPQTAAVVDQVTRAAAQAIKTTENLNRGGKQFGQTVWSPVKRLSGVLWLEFTGVFFGLFALSAGSAAWKLRGAWHETATNHDERTKLFLAIGIAILFGYFCISSFLRARRRERGR